MPSWRRLDFHVGTQHIAFVPHGFDELRVTCILIELLPHAAYLEVDGALERIRVTSLREVQQLIAAEHTLGVLEKNLQQAKLRARQYDHHVLRIDEMPCGDIERPTRKADPRCCGGL